MVIVKKKIKVDDKSEEQKKNMELKSGIYKLPANTGIYDSSGIYCKGLFKKVSFDEKSQNKPVITIYYSHYAFKGPVTREQIGLYGLYKNNIEIAQGLPIEILTCRGAYELGLQ